jgi:hypothetical protein
MIVALLVSASTFGAVVTVQFAGQVYGSSGFPLPVGGWMTGCFTYDSSATNRSQSASRTILAISVPQSGFDFQRESFAFDVFNNWTFGSYPVETPTIDGLRAEFDYPGGYGVIWLATKDINLFADQTLPTTMPPLGQFEEGRHVSLTIEAVQPYQTAVARIEYLHEFSEALPVTGFTFTIVGGEIRFNFSGSPTANYLVEATESLSAPEWTPIVEIAGIAGNFSVPGNSGQRFFRLQPLPCKCR